MSIITNEANSRICQATGLPPILVFNKEKEHLLSLPHDKVCSFYKNITISVKVNTNALFKYKQNMYSVPPELIGKTIIIEVTEDKDRKSTRLNSSHANISYAVFCLKKN